MNKLIRKTRCILIKILMILATCILAPILLNSCGEKFEYKKVLKENIYSEYKEFLIKYPNGPYSKSVIDRIEALKFKETKTLNNLSAYENYLIEYPNGIFFNEAKDSIEVQKFYLAKTNDSILLLRAYLMEYPVGRFTDTVKCILEELTKEQVLKYFGYIDGTSEILKICGVDLKDWRFGRGINMNPGTIRLDMFCNEQIAIITEAIQNERKVSVLYLADRLVIEYGDGQKLIFNNLDQQKYNRMKQIADKIKKEGLTFGQEIKGMHASCTLMGGEIIIQ
jgi:hypothetical protein